MLPPPCACARHSPCCLSRYKQYGHNARNWMVKHNLMSKAENAWATHMATGWEKAPVTMLAEQKAPPTVWQQLGVQDPSTAATNVSDADFCACFEGQKNRARQRTTHMACELICLVNS
eukprot:2492079-Rhodomonas_salina.1